LNLSSSFNNSNLDLDMSVSDQLSRTTHHGFCTNKLYPLFPDPHVSQKEVCTYFHLGGGFPIHEQVQARAAVVPELGKGDLKQGRRGVGGDLQGRPSATLH